MILVPADRQGLPLAARAPRVARARRGGDGERRGALASLVRGEDGERDPRNGVPHGAPIISLSRRGGADNVLRRPSATGEAPQRPRYPIAVVGPGYSGVLTSSSTRLPGLVSIADVAPSVRALRRGEEPRIRSKPSGDPFGALADLDYRLDQAHDSRIPATLVLIGLLTVLGVLALVTRAPVLGRAAFLAPSSCIAAAVALSALGGDETVGDGLGSRSWDRRLAGAAACSFLRDCRWRSGSRRFRLPFAVMWAKPEWNTLAVIGPHPDGGGRFYGVTNQIETLLLAPALVLGALAGARLLPAIALAIAAGSPPAGSAPTAAASSSTSSGFLVLWLRLRRRSSLRRPSLRRRRLLQLRSRWSGSMRPPADRVTSPRPSEAVPARSSAISATGSTCRRRRSHPPGTRRSSSRASARSSGSHAPTATRGARRPARRPRVSSSSTTRHRRRGLGRPLGPPPLGLGEKRGTRVPPSVDSRRMRRIALLFGVLLALLLAGCGGRKTVLPTAETVIGAVPTTTTAAAALRGTRRPVPRSSRRRAAAAATRSSRPGRTEPSGRTWTSSPSTRRPPASRSTRSRTSRSPTRAPTSRRGISRRCPTSATRSRQSRSRTSSPT